MVITKCECACQKIGCCKSCSYKNPALMDPLQYDYWNQTWWNNWNTTDGWGPFPSSQSGQNNNTYDNLSGFGTHAPATTNGQPNWPWCNKNLGKANFMNRVLPNGKKLVRIYKLENRFYDKSDDMVYYNNYWVPVSTVPGVEKTFKIISV